MASGLKNAFLNGGLFGISIVMALLFGELIIRMLCPTPNYGYIPQVLEQNIFRYDAELGWSGIPLVQNTYRAKDYVVTASLDLLGYRNRTPVFDNSKDNYLVLGDSYAWGAGVEDDETATFVLSSEYDGINVYNISAPGYGTDQELLALKKFWNSYLGMHYKKVFLIYYCNDIDDVLSTSRYGYNKPVFILNGQMLILSNVPVPQGRSPREDHTDPNIFDDYHPVFSRSQLYNFVTRRAASVVLKRYLNFLEGENVPARDVAGQSENFSLQIALLENMRQVVSQHGSSLHVVFLVTQNTPAEKKESINALFALAIQAGIESSKFVSAAVPATDLWYDGHFSQYGQRKLARHIYSVMADEGR